MAQRVVILLDDSERVERLRPWLAGLSLLLVPVWLLCSFVGTVILGLASRDSFDTNAVALFWISCLASPAALLWAWIYYARQRPMLMLLSMVTAGLWWPLLIGAVFTIDLI